MSFVLPPSLTKTFYLIPQVDNLLLGSQETVDTPNGGWPPGREAFFRPDERAVLFRGSWTGHVGVITTLFPGLKVLD